MQSPTVMSLIKPPLQARTVATLVAARSSVARAAIPGPVSSRSRSNPSGSRVTAITDARNGWKRVSIHGRPGRITSAQTAISSPASRSLRSQELAWPRSCSQPAGSTSQPAPGWFSAPEASQRCCQVSPGKEASQRSSLTTPRRRICRVALRAGTNGGEVSRSSVSSCPATVKGHAGCAGRAGNRARNWPPPDGAAIAAGAAASAGRRAACLTTALTPACQTARPATADHNRAPAAAVHHAARTDGRDERAHRR